MPRSIALGMLPLAAWLLAACASSPLPTPLATYDQIAEDEDLRREQPAATIAALQSADADLRRRAARCLGRLRDPQLAGLLEARLADEPDPGVRVEIAFALGQIGAPTSPKPLCAKLTDPDPRVRAAVVEALGKSQDDALADDLLPLLLDPEPAVRATAATAQFRLGAKRYALPRKLDLSFYRRRVELLGQALSDTAPEVRFGAALALAEIGSEDTPSWLRRGLRDRDGEVRRICVWGLAHQPLGHDDANAIAERLWDTDWRVVVEALRGLPANESSPQVADRIVELARGATLPCHVRAAALDALGHRPLTTASEQMLREALADRSGMVLEAGLVGLARALGERAAPEVARLAGSPQRAARTSAARAAALILGAPGLDLLSQLGGDPDPAVRLAALEALQRSAHGKDAIARACRKALDDADLALRTDAVSGLKTAGSEEDGPRLLALYPQATGVDAVELRLAIVQACAALLGGRSLELLQSALADPALAVRLAAADQLKALTGQVFPVGTPPVARQVTPRAGTDYLLPQPNPVVYLKTDRGLIGIELLREEAPTHVKSFLDLMDRRFFDGLTFHRVESNWVIQGLDPRGDGWGTGGLALRDEINPVPFLRGTVGMPNAGKDTAGCQIFILQIHAPRLDGGYTAFGRVVVGLDVVDRIEVGDRVHWVRPASFLLEHPEETTSVSGTILPTQ